MLKVYRLEPEISKPWFPEDDHEPYEPTVADLRDEEEQRLLGDVQAARRETQAKLAEMLDRILSIQEETGEQ
jgi:hypothetical protein